MQNHTYHGCHHAESGKQHLPERERENKCTKILLKVFLNVGCTLKRKSLTCFVKTKPLGSVVITKPLALQASLCACKKY